MTLKGSPGGCREIETIPPRARASAPGRLPWAGGQPSVEETLAAPHPDTGTPRMNYAIELDAAEVLGVAPGASLQEIHEAYRSRVKKHHPDVGGDDWAFRAVARAYETLSHARIRTRIGFEAPAPATDLATVAAAARPEPFLDDDEDEAREAVHPAPADADSEFVREGVRDRVDDPGQVVDVELFTIRYEFTGTFNLLGGPENRNLSSCVHLTWPAPPAHEGDPELPADPETLRRLTRAFDRLPRRTRATSHWSDTKDGRFVAWMSYPTANQAFEAFEALHKALNEKGLGVRQSTRELFIARGSR